VARVFEFRCPVHGFIEFDEWERDIINQPAFQRLRRIRQLGWTDYIYPGAMHTRFEHSLGVMHLATRLYRAISKRSRETLESEFSYNAEGIARDERIVRLAALLHDLGHGPFSHAAEDLLPLKTEALRYAHEDYSAAFVRDELRGPIEDHPLNGNYGIKADDIASLLEGSTKMRGLLFWRELLTGQMDADRMDYLLRDSLHLGVQYGKFDLDRIANTICAVPSGDEEAARIGIAEGGWHAAESLILARYYMFTQVYFHSTRVAYDHHIAEALRFCLPKSEFPKPVKGSLLEYRAWDDWRALGKIGQDKAGDHGKRLANREHYRLIFATGESPDEVERESLDKARAAFGNLLALEGAAAKSWYKVDKTDIPVLMQRDGPKALSALSAPIGNMSANNRILLYVKPEDRKQATDKLKMENLL